MHILAYIKFLFPDHIIIIIITCNLCRTNDGTVVYATSDSLHGKTSMLFEDYVIVFLVSGEHEWNQGIKTNIWSKSVQGLFLLFMCKSVQRLFSLFMCKSVQSLFLLFMSKSVQGLFLLFMFKSVQGLFLLFMCKSVQGFRLSLNI